MAHPDTLALLTTLRQVLKARGYTYARLGHAIGVSEVTIKRIFSGQNCSLERVSEMCEAAGVSLFDVAALAQRNEEVNYFLSAEQDVYFAAKPAHFAIFKELHRGVSSSDLRKSWGLAEGTYFKILRALEKLGLIEILPGDRVRVKARGNVRLKHRGELAKKILRPQIMDFLNHIDVVLENKDVCMHSAEVELSEKRIPEFVAEIHALGIKYRTLAFRDKSLLPSKKLKSVRWLFAFAPYQTNWRSYKP